MSSYNPDQYGDPATGLDPDKARLEREKIISHLQDELVAWIDPNVIAENILDEMQDQHLDLSLDNAKNVWLDYLENLNIGLAVSVDRVGDRITS